MSAPGRVACLCGHGQAAHSVEGLAPQCTAAACTCLRYRPDATSPISPARSATPATATSAGPSRLTAAPEPPGPTLDQLVDAGRRSGSQRVNALAEKIAALGGELRGKLAAERAAAEAKRAALVEKETAKREVQRLERLLVEARAKVRGSKPSAAKAVSSPRVLQPCPECGHEFANLGVHRSRAHREAVS